MFKLFIPIVLGLALLVGSGEVIHACVTNGTGAVRIVSAETICTDNERALEWGVIGLQGPQGDPGATGATGPQGLPGETGATGAVGPQGPKGDTGAIGATGATGLQGAQGDIGPTGEAGAKGTKGDKGDTGETGLQGLKGEPGDTVRADPPCFNNTHRFVDCGNGTVHDTMTGLIWMKDANCTTIFGPPYNYAVANILASAFKHGDCGLTDNSLPGDWRLPSNEEWEMILKGECDAEPRIVGNGSPTVGCYGDSPWVSNLQSSGYWSSTPSTSDTLLARVAFVNFGRLGADIVNKTSTKNMWPVRGGQ